MQGLKKKQQSDGLINQIYMHIIKSTKKQN